MKSSINQKWEMICKSMNEFETEYHKLANYYHLSDSSFWILYELYQNEKGCTQKELYTDWNMNKQTINSSVKYLTSKGYITLEYLDDNKKSKKIRITENGRKMAKQTIGRVIEMEEKAFEGIDEKKMELVIDFFKEQAESFKKEVNKVIQGKENEDE